MGFEVTRHARVILLQTKPYNSVCYIILVVNLTGIICVCDGCALYLCDRFPWCGWYVQIYHRFLVHKINLLVLMLITTVIVSYNS